MLKQELAQKLTAVEHRLNEIEIGGCQIGAVLSKFHENIYRGKSRKLNVVVFTGLLFRQWLKGLKLSKPCPRVSNTQIFLSRITDQHQQCVY
ncbi:MAG: hypothetical protein U5L96_08810 [Owenweeksia sp.]|nr:hypothetical protein [Owenweeksia sp.]